MSLRRLELRDQSHRRIVVQQNGTNCTVLECDDYLVFIALVNALAASGKFVPPDETESVLTMEPVLLKVLLDHHFRHPFTYIEGGKEAVEQKIQQLLGFLRVKAPIYSLKVNHGVVFAARVDNRWIELKDLRPFWPHKITPIP